MEMHLAKVAIPLGYSEDMMGYSILTLIMVLDFKHEITVKNNYATKAVANNPAWVS